MRKYIENDYWKHHARHHSTNDRHKKLLEISRGSPREMTIRMSPSLKPYVTQSLPFNKSPVPQQKHFQALSYLMKNASPSITNWYHFISTIMAWRITGAKKISRFSNLSDNHTRAIWVKPQNFLKYKLEGRRNYSKHPSRREQMIIQFCSETAQDESRRTLNKELASMISVTISLQNLVCRSV